MDTYKEIERSIIKKYRKEIWKPFVKGINEYELIAPGDKIAICISGGKDSMLLAKCMQELQRHGKFDFELVFIVMDPGYHETNRQMIVDNAKKLNIPIQIFDTQIFDIVATVDKSPCYLCAKMRRGYLYKHAQELGCNKIALGHHFDDAIETTLMSMLYSGEVKTMMPKLHSLNFEGMELIRPLYMVKEADIIAWCKYNSLTFLQCACRFTEDCDREENHGKSKRQEMKMLIASFRKINPHIDMNIFRSMHNVNLSTVIGYRDDTSRHFFTEDYETNPNRIDE
ncbi:MAG: tRNA 2-thiocytidine biosynthesis TtcA family protein [Cellulosilyticaceae bacterium]